MDIKIDKKKYLLVDILHLLVFHLWLEKIIIIIKKIFNEISK